MAAGARSGVYRSLLYGLGISSIMMGGRCKSGITNLYLKVSLNQS